MQEVITSKNLREPLDSTPTPTPTPTPNVVDLSKIIRNIKVVVDNEKINDHPPADAARLALIKFTEKLAAEAKSGELLGIGGFAEYKDGYRFGLEGSYWLNPGTAVLPLMRLYRRIMSQIERDEDAEE